MNGRDGAKDAPCSPASGGSSAATASPFLTIYHAYFDFVWSSARSLGVDPDAIDDVVQEIFVVIHGRLHTLQEPAALRSWVYGIARRTVSDYHRSNRAKARLGAGFASWEQYRQSSQATPLEFMERRSQVELLAKLLAELDEAKREVFVAAEIEEMTVPEIAQALEIPLNTAYSRLRAARQDFEEGLARHAAREKGGRRV
jgi:RNA polymerase sigma-70 factor (ECF subfamily)